MDESFSELLEEYKEQEKMYSFEGERGVERLNKICSAIGYKETGFRYGSPLEEFLQDNSGAIEAILTWIEENGDNVEEWRENLETHLPEKE